jgi:hypothetical protein
MDAGLLEAKGKLRVVATSSLIGIAWAVKGSVPFRLGANRRISHAKTPTCPDGRASESSRQRMKLGTRLLARNNSLVVTTTSAGDV